MTEKQSNITALLMCFNTVLTCDNIGSVVVLPYPSIEQLGVPPDDVLQEIIDNFIKKYNFTEIQ